MDNVRGTEQLIRPDQMSCSAHHHLEVYTVSGEPVAAAADASCSCLCLFNTRQLPRYKQLATATYMCSKLHWFDLLVAPLARCEARLK